MIRCVADCLLSRNNKIIKACDWIPILVVYLMMALGLLAKQWWPSRDFFISLLLHMNMSEQSDVDEFIT